MKKVQGLISKITKSIENMVCRIFGHEEMWFYKYGGSPYSKCHRCGKYDI